MRAIAIAEPAAKRKKEEEEEEQKTEKDSIQGCSMSFPVAMNGRSSSTKPLPLPSGLVGYRTYDDDDDQAFESARLRIDTSLNRVDLQRCTFTTNVSVGTHRSLL